MGKIAWQLCRESWHRAICHGYDEFRRHENLQNFVGGREIIYRLLLFFLNVTGTRADPQKHCLDCWWRWLGLSRKQLLERQRLIPRDLSTVYCFSICYSSCGLCRALSVVPRVSDAVHQEIRRTPERQYKCILGMRSSGWVGVDRKLLDSTLDFAVALIEQEAPSSS